MLDLKRRGGDIRRYVHELEELAIRTLAGFGVRGERREGRIGIWVVRADGSEAKIGAIGVRVRRWVSYHGLALNLSPDLGHFAGIVPCGISDYGVTSLSDLGVSAAPKDLDAAVRRQLRRDLREGLIVPCSRGPCAFSFPSWRWSPWRPWPRRRAPTPPVPASSGVAAFSTVPICPPPT